MRKATFAFLITLLVFATARLEFVEKRPNRRLAIGDNERSAARSRYDRDREKRTVLLFVPGTGEENGGRVATDSKGTATRRNQKTKRCKAALRSARVSMPISGANKMQEANGGRARPKSRKNVDSVVYQRDFKGLPDQASLELPPLRGSRPLLESLAKLNLQEAEEDSGEDLLLGAARRNGKSGDYDPYNRRSRPQLSLVDDKYVCYCREKNPEPRRRLDEPTLGQTWSSRPDKIDKTRKMPSNQSTRLKKPDSNNPRVGSQRLPPLYSDSVPRVVGREPAEPFAGTNPQSSRNKIPYPISKARPSQSNSGFDRPLSAGERDDDENVRATNERYPCPPIVGHARDGINSHSAESEEEPGIGDPFDKSLLNYEECMKLYGRDVCVISASSSGTRGQNNFRNQYYPIGYGQNGRTNYDFSESNDQPNGYIDYADPRLGMTEPTVPSFIGTQNPQETIVGRTQSGLSDEVYSDPLDAGHEYDAPSAGSEEKGETCSNEGGFVGMAEPQSDENSGNDEDPAENRGITEESISDELESKEVTPMPFTSEFSVDEDTAVTVDPARSLEDEIENESSTESIVGAENESPTTTESGIRKFPDESETASEETTDNIVGKSKTKNPSDDNEENVEDEDAELSSKEAIDATSEISILEDENAEVPNDRVTDSPVLKEIGPAIDRSTQDDLASDSTSKSYDASRPVEDSASQDENVGKAVESAPTATSGEAAIESEEAGNGERMNLPFCDNSLLQKSIKSAINDFAKDPSDQDEDTVENGDGDVVRATNDELLPEILEVPNLKGILSIPEVENTIIGRVRNILSEVTTVSRSSLSSKWATNVIRDNLRHMTAGMSSSNTELPPLAVEEHHVRNGVWTTDLVTLAPSSDEQVGSAMYKELHGNVRDLLYNPAFTLKAAKQPVVKNMIVASVRNSYDSGKNETEQCDDYVVRDILNDMLNKIDQQNPGEDEPPSAEDEPESDKTEDKEADEDDDYEEESDASILRKIIESSTLPDMGDIDESEEEVSTATESFVEESKPPPVDTQQAQKATKNTYRKTVPSGARDPKEKDISIYSGETSTAVPPISEKLDEEGKTLGRVPLAENFVPGKTAPPFNYESSEESRPTDFADLTEVSPTEIPNYREVNAGFRVTNERPLEGSTEGSEAKSSEIQNFSEDTPIEENSDSSVLEPDKDDSISSGMIDDKVVGMTHDVPKDSPTRYYDPKDRVMEYIKNHPTETPTEESKDPTDNQEAATDYEKQVTDSGPTKAGQETDVDVSDLSSGKNEGSEVVGTGRNSDNYEINGKKDGVVGAERNLDKPEDFTYFGKISVENKRAGSNDFQSLKDSDLFYVGDGVKLPLEIRRLGDGSYGLSISRKICEYILNKECPCCVPLQGNVVRTVRRGNGKKRHSRSSVRLNRKRRGGIDEELQLISMPVEAFAKMYNLSLTLDRTVTSAPSVRREVNSLKNGPDAKVDKDHRSMGSNGKFRLVKKYPIDFHEDSSMDSEDDEYESLEYRKSRFQRNTDGNSRTKIITDILTWVKNLLLSLNDRTLFDTL